MKRYSYIFLFFILTSCTPKINFSVQLRPAHSVAMQIASVPKTEKTTFLNRVNKGESKFLFQKKEGVVHPIKMTSLLGESRTVVFDISNEENKENTTYTIETNLPRNWNQQIYRQALLNEWYSTNKNVDNVKFIGDPLLKINPSDDKIKINLRPNETARLVLDFTVHDSIVNEIEIKVKSKKTKKTKKIRLTVLNINKPETEFSSIIFNSHNIQSNGEFIDICNDAGFTHLQANYIPTVYFDKKGNPIGDINLATTNSTGYRNTVFPWVKNGGKILIFWQPRYQTLAPTKDGNYLTPFTDSWLNAFSNLLKIVSTDLKTRFKSFDSNDMVVYIADEFSTTAKKNNRADYIKLLNHLKKKNPNTKTFLTYGFYSNKTDVNLLGKAADISCPHFLMPKKVVRNKKKYNPSSLKDAMKSLRLKKSQNWTYHVAKGKSSDIREFLYLPSIAVIKDYSSFSWWGFLSHSGSTWTADDLNQIDYSFVYLKEEKNAIYNQWKTNDNSRFITSMRIKAIRLGILNAKILQTLIENKNKLSQKNQTKLNKLIKVLAEESYTYNNSLLEFNLTLNEFNNIVTDLRLLLFSLKK